MRAFGGDRVHTDAAGRVILSSRTPKGWNARVPRTNTSVAHPGTAVQWDEAIYEVVEAEQVGEGYRYVLEPWREENAMRVVDVYDAATVAQRARDYRAGLRREKQRKSVTLLGFFAGLLPAVVQDHLESELGVAAPRLTLMSAILEFACFAGIVLWVVEGRFQGVQRPLWVLIVGAICLQESAIRTGVAVHHQRPIGSVFGVFGYILFYMLVPRRERFISPFAVPKGLSTRWTASTPDIDLQDAFIIREPLLTLLSPAEQKLLEERFGYDYRKSSKKIAITFFIFAAAGVTTSLLSLTNGFRFGALLSLLVALTIALEQLKRLSVLDRGPVGSMLGFPVRMFSKRLFE